MSESEPLLSSPAGNPTVPGRNELGSEQPQATTINSRYVFGLSVLIITLIDTGEYISAASKLQILEDLICRDHFSARSPLLAAAVPQDPCKDDAVQARLASLIGWQVLTRNIPTLLLAIPYGALADSRGRRPVATLAFLGAALAYSWTFLICFLGAPVNLILYSSLFYIIGGGPSVVSALVLLVISDVTPEADRATAFFRCLAGILLSELLSPILGYWLMVRNVWIPMYVGLVLVCLPPLLTWWALPETNSVASKTAQSSSATARSPERLGRWPRLRTRIGNEFKFFTSSWATSLGILATFITKPAIQAMELILQYVPKRYGWTIARAGLLSSVRSASSMVVLLLFLPWLSSYLSKRLAMSSVKKDVGIATGSLLFMIAGYTLIGLAPNVSVIVVGLVLTALGSGFNGSLRSLVTYLVERDQPQEMGRLYTFLAIIEAVGGLVSGPFVSSTYRLGLSFGPPWLGLTYLASAVLFLLPLFIVLVIHHLVHTRETRPRK
ncbi:major facilitator superfamily domain-containing protein [Nemania sp. FL0916]|nr:major facilitator superfamily domain-containing protein [Nemania sp. FL0916]